MRQYEMTYLASDKIGEADLNKVTGKVSGFVAESGGKLIKEEIWKRRKLAYAIKKQEFATYVTINFNLPGDKMIELDRQLRLYPDVIRHLLIVEDQGSKTLTLSQDEIVGMEAIEAVAGGERSFEAIEGKTEDSRDLMAVREQEEETTDETGEVEQKVEKTQEQTEEQEPATEPEAEKEADKPATMKKEKEAGIKSKKKKTGETTEADRLAKLDKELDEILKEDL